MADTAKQPEDDSKVSMSGVGNYDSDIYTKPSSIFRNYDMSIPATEEGREEEEDGMEQMLRASTLASAVKKATAVQKAIRTSKPNHEAIKRFASDALGKDVDPFEHIQKKRRIVDQQNEYQQRWAGKEATPARRDPFATPALQGDKTPASGGRGYKEVMLAQRQRREQVEKAKEEHQKKSDRAAAPVSPAAPSENSTPLPSSHRSSTRSRWDDGRQSKKESSAAKPKAWDETPGVSGNATPAHPSWESTPAPSRSGAETPGTPGLGSGTPMTPHVGSQTPMTPHGSQTPMTPHYGSATPLTPSKRNRWDETPGRTPRGGLGSSAATPVTPGGATPSGFTPGMGSATPSTPFSKKSRWDQTPATPSGGLSAWTPGQTVVGNQTGVVTPTPGHLPSGFMEIHEHARHLTDKALDDMFPDHGYEIVDAPADYQPVRTPYPGGLATPTPARDESEYRLLPGTSAGGRTPHLVCDDPEVDHLIRPSDEEYIKALFIPDDELSFDQVKEKKIMKLLLAVKNGSPPERKRALRQLTDKATLFGAGPLFNQILPLLMAPTLEDQERHLLVKVIDRVLYRLDDKVRPYVHKILVVIEPLLIDQDYYARVEGREIISNLAKAAGLATMISTMRPDIDSVDEYVRNTTARAFSVVASALGIAQLLPFLQAVCESKKSWQARHTGIKIVQQIAILMGCAVLPYLRDLVEIIQGGLTDTQSKVRTICALALAALAEAAYPYGIEAFDDALKPLWSGVRLHSGKTLGAFLKAVGYIIPLMDSSYASYYTREIMVTVVTQFSNPDDEMKRIVLMVVKQCVSTDGVSAGYIREEIMPEFFRQFWTRRMALEKRNYQYLVETTVELGKKVGGAEIISRIVEDLKDESEPYRKMVMETIEKTVSAYGVADIDMRLEELLIDGMLYSFQEQTGEDSLVMLNGFGVVLNGLGERVKPYLPQICGIIKWRLNNKSARVREQAADLISRIAVVMKTCEETQLLGHLGIVLYEYLGEEYPEVLGSILGGLKAIVNVIGMSDMQPPIKDLLPRLTPILRNRHEKVQENCIDLVGRIADRGAEHVSAREWMRICFDLLEMLKAHKKGIRRATVNTFGYIAKAIGPQDVLATLLNNLRVQERQLRVCTTVAIAIVAETCSPFTVIPALMNEYRVRDLNVQNGVLKSLSFLFEYIGELGRDYIYAVTPLLEDALMERDLVHRQTACTTIKHLALGVAGLGREDALLHLLNHVWPNVFETSPHVINAVTEAIEGFRVALGPAVVYNYVAQGLFHPARKVRNVFWKIYNSLYIGSQDAMVAFYSVVPDDQNLYERKHLNEFWL